MTSHAPAFGMIGTLIGMIAMLCELNDNIAGAGSTLAVAFLSTLNGVASARMIYMPAASRLQQEVDRRQRRHDMITEGIVMLSRGEAVSHVQDRLNGFLRPEQRDYFDVIAGDADAAPTPSRAPRAPASRRRAARHGRRPHQKSGPVSPASWESPDYERASAPWSGGGPSHRRLAHYLR